MMYVDFRPTWDQENQINTSCAIASSFKPSIIIGHRVRGPGKQLSHLHLRILITAKDRT